MFEIDIPDYVKDAIEQTGYEYPYYEPFSRAFLQTWGDLEMQTFVSALQEGQGVDKIVAIFVVGASGIPSARELLLPTLQSSVPLERDAAARCLSGMKEERAIAVLLTMLTEFLPHLQYLTPDSIEWRYEMWRSRAARLLGEWEKKELITPLQDTLLQLVQYEKIIRESEVRIGPKSRLHGNLIKACQKEVVYALGRVEQFAWVEQQDIAVSLRNVWRIYLALGYLRAHREEPGVLQIVLSNKFMKRGHVFNVLEEKLGLSREEQEQCLKDLREDVLNTKSLI